MIALHGDCLVPRRWDENRALAYWVTKQRRAYNRGELKFSRIELLNELNFAWNAIDVRWERMFQKLLAFKEEYGHTNVSQTMDEYTELATWVRNQRNAKRLGRPVLQGRAERLEKIGFSWILKPNIWDVMFQRLKDFKRENGHCNVPQKWSEDKALGRWVNSQRIFYKLDKIKSDRMALLEGIGFVWNMKKP